jgi:hypothetical protein
MKEILQDKEKLAISNKTTFLLGETMKYAWLVMAFVWLIAFIVFSIVYYPSSQLAYFAMAMINYAFYEIQVLKEKQ